jgi:hypothetical protein
MILNPAIVALITGALLSCGYSLYAAWAGCRILRHWDIRSGSALQLQLERKTYLVSTILNYVLCFELLSLFLFIYTADDMHGLFVGAMCAAGTLNANPYGYPALVVKTISFLLCGTWMIINYTDNRGYDYPIIREKYRLLLIITAMILLETYLLIGFFLNLRADVITSCCGTLFSENAPSVSGAIAAVPSYPAKIIFYLSVVLTLRTGIHFLATARSAKVFSILSGWLLLFSLISVISFIGLYYYQLPTHHCPFCILQREYGYVGYWLYLSLLAAGIAGCSTGVIARYGNAESLKTAVPELQKKLCIFSMAGYIVFTAIASYPMIFSEFKLEGY